MKPWLVALREWETSDGPKPTDDQRLLWLRVLAVTGDSPFQVEYGEGVLCVQEWPFRILISTPGQGIPHQVLVDSQQWYTLERLPPSPPSRSFMTTERGTREFLQYVQQVTEMARTRVQKLPSEEDEHADMQSQRDAAMPLSPEEAEIGRQGYLQWSSNVCAFLPSWRELPLYVQEWWFQDTRGRR